MTTILIIISFLPFYLIGAFPTGMLISKLHGVDIAAQGSGNVGATNVARVIGKRAGILTLLCDVLKGVLGVGVAALLVGTQWYVVSAGVAVVLGHCFSIPGYLKGGKGVATALGVILALYPSSAVVALVTFGAVFAFSRIVSLASLAATCLVPLWAFVSNAPDATGVGFLAIAATIGYRHQENIRRIMEGREPKFSTAPPSAKV